MVVVPAGKTTEEGEGVPDVEEEEPQKEEEEVVNETMFTFDQFEQVRRNSLATRRYAVILNRNVAFCALGRDAHTACLSRALQGVQQCRADEACREPHAPASRTA